MTEWSGEDYADISALQRAMAEEAITSVQFAGTDQVLDVGCGDGHISRLIAGIVPEGFVVGIDPSPGMLGAARRGARPGPSGPSFARADVRDLPFAENFDVAVSFNALHWVPQQERALTQIASVMRPGARVLIQVVCAGERPSVEAVAMTLCDRPYWAQRFAGFTAPFIHVDPSDFGEFARKAGFVVADLTVTDRRWDFGTREHFARWSTVGTGAWTHRLTPADQTRFVDELVSAYETVSGQPGLFRFTQMRAALIRQ